MSHHNLPKRSPILHKKKPRVEQRLWTALCCVSLVLWLLHGQSCSSPAAQEAKPEVHADAGVRVERQRTTEKRVEHSTPELPDVAQGNDDALQEKAKEAAPEDVAPELPCPDRAPAPVQAPTPLTITNWQVGSVSPLFTKDPVSEAIYAGTMKFPPDSSYLGMGWKARTIGKNGSLGTFPGGTSYAVARVSMTKPQGVIVRADTSFLVYINGVRQPGDVYGTRKMRTPGVLRQGENLIVVHVIGRRKAPEIALWTTPHELHFNTSDLTTPTLVVGQSWTQCVGVPIVNLSGKPIPDLKVEVLGSERWKASQRVLPSLPAGATTQVAFSLVPNKAPDTAGKKVPVRLRLWASSLRWVYEREITLDTFETGKAYRRTRLSRIDGSCQFYGVLPPPKVDPTKKYGLILSLHGAGVNALGQARAYAAKDWAYLIAPTNRRPFGFDWEAWGREDGVEALEHAAKVYTTDPTKTYVTGHSMGGHGTWQFGVLMPGRFAVVGPSAGWDSFYSYTRRRRPTSFFARSQASSESSKFLSNLAKRSIYVIHGDADNNVPVREGRAMVAAAKKVCKDVQYHEQPGAGHWWNGKQSKGADCVDWPPMIATMKARTLDPFELDFSFTTPGPWVSATHSFVKILAQSDPYRDATVTAKRKGDDIALTTQNIAAMTLNGDALQAKGIKRVLIGVRTYPVKAGPIAVGNQDGKRPGQHGPFNEALFREFCFIYPDKGAPLINEYVAHLVSSWAIIGNGHACAMPLSQVADALRTRYNLIYIGVPSAQIKGAKVPFVWDATQIKIGTNTYKDMALAVVFPAGKRLAAALFPTKGQERLLFQIQPFTSSFSLPDYFVWSSRGGRSGGFFDANWAYDAKYQR